jgi:F-type H+-transporting ATPase subunit a
MNQANAMTTQTNHLQSAADSASGAQDLVYPAQNGDRLIAVNAPATGGTSFNIVIPDGPHARQAQGYLVAQAAPQPANEGEHAAHAPAADAAPASHGAATQGAAEHAAPGHEAAAEHGAHHAPTEYLMPNEIPNLATLIEAAGGKMEGHAGTRPHPSESWFINPLFTLVLAGLFAAVIMRGLRRPNIEKPGFLQNIIEALLGGLRNFFTEVLGPGGAKFVPYVVSLFLFIWVNNLAGLVPFLKAPTSSFKTTVALGIITFCYVHFNAIKEGGLWNWFRHLLGEPLWMCPLMFPLHTIGELIKPVSLSLRLFGNIFGEDKLLAAFLGMGMLIVATVFNTPTPLLGVPLHLPFFFLALLTCTIQSLVFSLLAAVYIVLLLPHEHHDEEHADTEAGKLVSDHGHAAVHGQDTSSPIAL